MIGELVVYHVHNPDVRGVVHGEDISGISVIFDEPVGFCGNPGVGKNVRWTCTKELLFMSPIEARANHDPSKCVCRKDAKNA